MLFFIPSLVSATDWYVRPAGGNYGVEDGSSYDNAWDSLLNVVWGSGGVQAGDTLYVCGFHTRTYSGGKHAVFCDESLIEPISGTSDSNRIIIRGDCPGDPAEIWTPYKLAHQPWVNEGNNTYSITLPDANHQNDLYFEDVSASGSYTLLDPASSLNECKNTPGTHYSDTYARNTILYVHTSDNGDPTGRIYAPGWGWNFLVNGKEYITFDSITFYANTRFIGTGYNAKHTTWKNCTFTYGTVSKIQNGCNYLTVEDCEISWVDNGPYSLSGDNNAAHHLTFRNNIIHDIGVRPSQQNSDSHGIGIQGGHHNIIEGNTFYNCGTTIALYAFTNQELKDTIIRYNLIKDGHTYGGTAQVAINLNCNRDSLSTKTGNQVYGNIITNHLVGLKDKYLQDEVVFYNNVVYNCTYGFRGYGEWNNLGPNTVLKNNIFLDNTYHLAWTSNALNKTLVSDYNIFYPDNGKRFIYRNSDQSFSEWQSNSWSGSVFDTNSLVANPLLVDVPTQDFHLQSTSPAIDAGIDVGLTMDYDGNPIPQGSAPDIGAYEFESSVVNCSIEGDLNNDCDVNINDLVIIASDFGLTTGFDPRADTDNDGEVDIFDVVFVASRFT